MIFIGSEFSGAMAVDRARQSAEASVATRKQGVGSLIGDSVDAEEMIDVAGLPGGSAGLWIGDFMDAKEVIDSVDCQGYRYALQHRYRAMPL